MSSENLKTWAHGDPLLMSNQTVEHGLRVAQDGSRVGELTRARNCGNRDLLDDSSRQLQEVHMEISIDHTPTSLGGSCDAGFEGHRIVVSGRSIHSENYSDQTRMIGRVRKFV